MPKDSTKKVSKTSRALPVSAAGSAAASGSDAPRRKPRANPGPTGPRKRKEKVVETKSSTLETGQNLTLGEWIDVLKFCEEHPAMTQNDVVTHFRALGFKFTQASLSKKLRRKAELLARANETPNALETKRPRVVTCPEVERALVLWFQHMESRGEVVSGPMLLEKRRRFEDQFDIPKEQRLTGDGWMASFKRAYGIKEHRRHGEAGSVNDDDAEAERVRLRKKLEEYEPHNRFNGDEGGLFAYAQPDRGLSTKQMSGKKSSKFRITVFFVCNSTGTEKEPLMFIGKSAKPRCFKHVSAAQRKKFYYRNNKKAWMTAVLFEEWVKQFDRKMRTQKRKVILLLDNFSGHDIGYKPTNVDIEFLAPNMTSRIQPLDAGVIRAFKAHYRRAFCMRALDADDAGEDDIWKLNLWEAMCMARDSWDVISGDTIRNCWLHTGIMPTAQPTPAPEPIPAPAPIPNVTPTAAPEPAAQPVPDRFDAAWTFLLDFVSNDMHLPEAEAQLTELLGTTVLGQPWREALRLANDIEDDYDARVAAHRSIEELRKKDKAARQGRATRTQAVITDAERDLQEKINELARRKLIRNALTADEFLDFVEERFIGDGVHELLTDEQIVAAVRAEHASKAAEGNGSESGDESDDEEPTTHLPIDAIIALCTQLEAACVARGVENASALRSELLKVKRELRQTELKTAKQLTIDGFLAKAQPQTGVDDIMSVDEVDGDTVSGSSVVG